jgi:hypothetical protein
MEEWLDGCGGCLLQSKLSNWILKENKYLLKWLCFEISPTNVLYPFLYD